MAGPKKYKVNGQAKVNPKTQRVVDRQEPPPQSTTSLIKNALQRELAEKRHNLPHIYGIKDYAWSKAFIDSTNRINLLTAGNQCLAKGTLVMTPKGPVPIETLSVGDTVYSELREPIKILKTYRNGIKWVADLTLRNKPWVSCTPEHIFYAGKAKRDNTKVFAEVPAFKLIPVNRQFVSRLTVRAPLGSVSLKNTYALGAMLGNGCCLQSNSQYQISSGCSEVPEHIAKTNGTDAKKLHVSNYTWSVGSRSFFDIPYYGEWCHNKYSYEKFVDLNVLKTWDRETLLQFVAGVFDTDGTLHKNSDMLIFGLTMQAKTVVDAFEYACLALWQVSLSRNVDSREKYRNGDVYGAYIRNASFIREIMEELDPYLVNPDRKWKPEYDGFAGKRTDSAALGLAYGKNFREEEVFDIEVDSPTNLYMLANGLVTHNCGKSVTLLRKNIHWATSPNLWPKLWPMNPNPRQFWYFYPSLEVATIEFNKKWVPDILPRGAMRKDPQYGWEEEYSSGDLQAIHFRSGVSLYIKSYAKKVEVLQTSTVHMVSGDEELPENLVDELMSRLAATGGHFNLVFTATQGLQLWYRAMECQGKAEEAFKTAFKWQVSLYDCQTFIDGTVGHWPIERIKEREAMCTSHKEILKRIHGKFVKDEGLRYANYTPDLCQINDTKPPSDWKYYAGVDIGSGGNSKHRSKGAIVIVAAAPDFSRGRVVRTWRGDFQETTSQDILKEFVHLTKDIPITQACYDYASREFGLIASRSGIPFVPAEKHRVKDEQTINSLFGAKALLIDEGKYDNDKLTTELMSIPSGATKNRKFTDDLCDSLKFACSLVPWDFTKMGVPVVGADGPQPEEEYAAPPVHLSKEEYDAWEMRQRRGEMRPKSLDSWEEFYAECDDWQRMHDGEF